MHGKAVLKELSRKGKKGKTRWGAMNDIRAYRERQRRQMSKRLCFVAGFCGSSLTRALSAGSITMEILDF